MEDFITMKHEDSLLKSEMPSAFDPSLIAVDGAPHLSAVRALTGAIA